MEEILNIAAAAIAEGAFVKLSLERYHGAEPQLKSLHIRPIIIKREAKLSFTYRYKTRDIVKNHAAEEALQLLRDMAADFEEAVLFTSQEDVRWKKNKLSRMKPSHPEGPSLDHDRQKKRLLGSEGKAYLHALGITDTQGKVFHNAQDKFRQINKYIEILDGLVKPLAQPEGRPLKVADMGSGKGYLTFALYDHLVNTLGRQAEVVGVEYRQDMVDLCNRIARDSGFSGLRFVQGAIAGYDSAGTDILIALHACDTATDEALYKGITAAAEIIVVAPCCHKQIRREIEANKAQNELDFLLKYGTFMERQAEMVTDGMRALLLNHSGYDTKAFEFISDAHTPKNVMIVGRKRTQNDAQALALFRARKAYFGIGHHHLEKMLGL